MPSLTSIISQICELEVKLLMVANRVDLLEHSANQQSILVDTLGDIMEELKRQELQGYMPKSIFTKDIKTGHSTTMVMRRRMRRAPTAVYPVKTKNQHSLKQNTTIGTKNSWTILFGTGVGASRVAITDVAAGNHVYRLTFNINAIHPSGSGSGNFDFYICYMRHGQVINTDFPSADWSDIGLSKVRNQIFYSEQNQLGTEDGGRYTRKFSVKVPKLCQRIREGDSIRLIWDNSETLNTNFGVRFSSFS